jgi:hypothetical protein
MFDGTTVTMPDTPENQAAYPQVYGAVLAVEAHNPVTASRPFMHGVIDKIWLGAINGTAAQFASKRRGDVGVQWFAHDQPLAS